MKSRAWAWSQNENECKVCGQRCLSKCIGCHITFYCSGKCQKEDWEVHKRGCLQAKKERLDREKEIRRFVLEDSCLHEGFGVGIGRGSATIRMADSFPEQGVKNSLEDDDEKSNKESNKKEKSGNEEDDDEKKDSVAVNDDDWLNTDFFDPTRIKLRSEDIPSSMKYLAREPRVAEAIARMRIKACKARWEEKKKMDHDHTKSPPKPEVVDNTEILGNPRIRNEDDGEEKNIQQIYLLMMENELRKKQNECKEKDIMKLKEFSEKISVLLAQKLSIEEERERMRLEQQKRLIGIIEESEKKLENPFLGYDANELPSNETELSELREKNTRILEEYRRKCAIANDNITRKETEKKSHSCRICLERKNQVAFQCGHLVCVECSKKISECPYCRKKIISRLRIYGV